jgi:hypothetical protein
MKKLTNVFLLAGAIALLAVGCKGKGAAAGGDPKTVITAFFEKMAKKDIDGAARLCTKDSKSTMDMMKKGMDAAEKMGEMKGKDDTEDFKDMVVGDAKIDGDDATVSITNKKKEETIEFPLKKEDGAWKVDFTMGTLMKMGMNEMNKQGKNPFTDGINGSDTTSMDDAMDKAKEALENIKPEDLEKAKKAMENIKPQDIEKMKEMMEKMKQN